MHFHATDSFYCAEIAVHKKRKTLVNPDDRETETNHEERHSLLPPTKTMTAQQHNLTATNRPLFLTTYNLQPVVVYI